MNMLQGSLAKEIPLFTLPIVLSSILQQLFNFADIAIIGIFDNAQALAAIGTNGEIISLIISISVGLSIGTNVLIAGFIGSKSRNISKSVHTSVLFSILFGFVLLLIGEIFANRLLQLIQTPLPIMKLAETYFRIYLLSVPFLVVFDFGASILRARGESKYPFKVLIISGSANVVLNYVFVVLFQLSVAGVAIASVIATMLSCYLVIVRLTKEDSEFQLSFRKLSIDFKVLHGILMIGIPAALQGAVFGLANIFVQATVNTFGENAIAGSTIAMNFEYFAYYVITGFGFAATTFTSQNYAAKNYKRCTKILILCLAYSTLFALIFTLPVAVFPDFFSLLFTQDKTVVSFSSLRIRDILLFEAICCFYEIPAGYIRGCGHSTIPALATIVGTCLFRIMWIYFVFPEKRALDNLYIMFPYSWIVTIFLMMLSLMVAKYQNQKFTKS